MSALGDMLKGKANIVIPVVVLAAIVGLIIFVLHNSTSNFSPLYTGLSLEDSAKVVAELEKSNTPYELVSNGSVILVPADRVLRARMGMAEQGLPSGGSVVGYEIFDKAESFGSSNAVFSINVMRALEGELSRTIGSLTDVENARVHLVMPKRELFTRDKDKPSASVTVKMRGGHALEHGEVMGIAHLVSSAVPGLEVSKVTIIDNHGRLLARGDGEGSDVVAGNAQEFKVAYETHIQQTLEDLVEKVIGTGKVRVQVAADIDLDRVVTNSEKYDPDGQVVRSVQSNTERENAQEKTPKENTSVASNLPPPPAGSDGGSSNRLNEHSGETTNYEISKTVQNHITEGGKINKISVAVLVDGNYSGDDKKQYTPRTDDELKQLKTLISSAIGYDEKRGDKIEVVNMRFTQDSLELGNESFFERFKLEAQSIIQTLIIAIVAIVAILLVLRPAVKQLISQSQPASQRLGGELAALGNAAGTMRLPGSSEGGESPSGENEKLIDVANIKGGMKSSTMRQVSEIVDKYPDETMTVLRNWTTK